MNFEIFNTDHLSSMVQNWWSGTEVDRDRNDVYYYFGMKHKIDNMHNVRDLINPLFNRFRAGNNSKVFEYKMELFTDGRIVNTNELGEFALCKPWVVDADNNYEIQMAESFLFIVPMRVLKNMIVQSEFLDHINRDEIKNIRVLQREFMFIDFDYKHFGVLNVEAPRSMKSKELRIKQIDNIQNNKEDITAFYQHHYIPIENERAYFNPDRNVWYELSLIETEEPIGYYRLYEESNSFFGGFYIEYVISKDYRNQGIATRLCKIMRNYVLKNSFAYRLRAVVYGDNEASKRVLYNSDFALTTNSFHHGRDVETFDYDLLTPYLEMFDKSYHDNEQKVQIAIDESKFSMYFQ